MVGICLVVVLAVGLGSVAEHLERRHGQAMAWALIVLAAFCVGWWYWVTLFPKVGP